MTPNMVGNDLGDTLFAYKYILAKVWWRPYQERISFQKIPEAICLWSTSRTVAEQFRNLDSQRHCEAKIDHWRHWTLDQWKYGRSICIFSGLLYNIIYIVVFNSDPIAQRVHPLLDETVAGLAVAPLVPPFTVETFVNISFWAQSCFSRRLPKIAVQVVTNTAQVPRC